MAWRNRGAVACAALLLAGLIACSERKAQSFQPGQVFPPVPLVSLTGGASALPETLRGRALVINFWATWCEPCRKEMPSLERLHQQIDPAKLAVIGVSVDTDLNLAREFLHQYALTFPNYSDSTQKLARDSLKIQAFPVTFLVAADGTVRAQITGARDWASPDTLDLLERTLNVSIGTK